MALLTVATAVGAQLQTPAPTAAHQDRFVVVLDAAHGGADSGAVLSGSTAERSVTLALSIRLRSLLNARGISVVTTREKDADLSPDDRAAIANRTTASACLSLHATQSGNGVHLFTSSLSPAQPARFLPWKTAQSAFVTQSLKLASVLNSAFVRSRPPGNDSAPDLPVSLGRTNLPGVDSMTCPAVAIEFAPLHGPDRQITAEVTDSAYQSRLVEAIAAAIISWRSDWQQGAQKP